MAGPDPVLMANTLLAKSQAMLNEKKIEALEKQVSLGKQAVEASHKAVDHTISNDRLHNVGLFIKNVGTFFRNIIKPFGFVVRDLAPYIALILVIMFIFMGVRFGRPRINLGLSSARRDKIYRSIKSPFRRFFAWWEDKLSMLAPGYRYRALMRMMNPLGGKFNTSERPHMVAGRCDNAEWRELGGDGRPGLCAKTVAPKDINWIMDANRMPELNKVPQKLYAEITNNGKRMQVIIPWSVQGTFYVPQCSKAVFSDGKPAGHLFIDDGMACRKKEVAVPKFEARYRLRGVPVDQYVSESDPKI